MAKLTNYNIAIVAFVCLGAFTYGYSFAVFATSIGQPGFYAYFKLDPSSSYTASIIGAVNSLFAAGAAFGAIAQGWIGDWLGRKKAFAIGSTFAIVGGALTAGSVHIGMLIAMRFIQGLGLGQLIALVPLYITEVAPAHRRGALAGMTAASFATGYVIAAWVGFGAYYSPDETLQWRLPLSLSCLAPLILLCGIWKLPESPRYLAWVDRGDEAWRIIQKIHHDPADATDSAARAEYVQITKQVAHDKTQNAGYLDMFKKPSWRRRSIMVIFLMLASQSCGILGITNFIILIAQSLGLTGSMPLLMYSVYTVVATIPNFIGSLLMDKIGRRKLLLIGFPSIALILLAEALLQRRYVGTDDRAGNAAAIFFIFLYGAFYGFFLDPAQFVWCTEIFPTTIRAKGVGLTFFSYFVGAITYTTPGALAFKNIGWKMYMVWFTCNIVSTVVIYFFLPETANLPLEEIGALFGDEVVIHMTADGQGLTEVKGLAITAPYQNGDSDENSKADVEHKEDEEKGSSVANFTQQHV